MSNALDFTVCTFTYDRYPDLENLIRSFTKQLYKNCELLIIDDLGSNETEKVVRIWQKKDQRIVYHKNKVNLGFSQNLKNSYRLAKGKYILFMGDDDIFIENNVLQIFKKAFDNKSVGVVKAAQLLHKNKKINQAYAFPKTKKIITIFDSGLDTYKNIWFDSLSITGLAFRICPEIFSALNTYPTLYPQVEHMGIMCLTYKSVRINKYLVGVQSHAGQLNCISYLLDGVKTNLIEDWLAIHSRINSFAIHNHQIFLSEFDFKAKLAAFIPLFFPYNRLTNGFLDTAKIIFKTFKLYPLIIVNLFFLASLSVSLAFPPMILQLIIEKVKKRKLSSQISKKDLEKYNKLLKNYYP